MTPCEVAVKVPNRQVRAGQARDRTPGIAGMARSYDARVKPRTPEPFTFRGGAMAVADVRGYPS